MTHWVQLYFYWLFNTGKSFAFFMRFYSAYGKFAELMKQSFSFKCPRFAKATNVIEYEKPELFIK